MGIIDGSLTHAYGVGALLSIIAIVMVFLILWLIILLTEWIAKVIVKDEEVKQEAVPTSSGACALNLNDEDATVAALVASIDYRNETKKNVKVVSVREVK